MRPCRAGSLPAPALASFAALAAVAALAAPALAAPAAAEGAVPRHELAVRLDPPRHLVTVRETLSGPSGTFEFLLDGKLKVTRSEPKVAEVPLGDVAPFFGNNGTVEKPGAAVPLKRYRATLAPGASLTLEYAGPIDFPLSDPAEQYTRGFRDTPGLVGPEGVYLAGSSFWVPYLGDGLVSFRMEAEVPAGWQLISQGSGTSRDEAGKARWDSNGPVDEVYLVGGPLQVWRDRAGAVEALVYLRERDDALAGKYLAATGQYLEMYRGLIGPYPYGKFALVENFWETGYGMASFTLLGPQVVRFPFILNSSYPHEILHNWWGNSVFVDYGSGNWCEGLTAYLADHLIQEQRGKGDEYRRGTLQRYRDYVKGERDFPLTDFRSRHSAATEAVGYGKSLMTFHMLRRHVGDAAFRKGLAALYAGYRGKKAAFGDLEKVFGAASGKDLSWLFSAFVRRAGAPELSVVSAKAAKGAEGWEVALTLRQGQAGEPFPLDVPVTLTTAGKPVRQTVRMEGRELVTTLRTPDEPLALVVDPLFDLFRRLDPRETPASIGQVFGSARVLAVLPDGPEEERKALRELVVSWQSPSHAVEVVSAADVKELPADRAVWLLGRKNPLAARLFADGAELTVGPEKLTAGGESLALRGHTVVLTARNPKAADATVGWIFTDTLAALPGLGRKLPHYGKYSFLAFDGTEPVNDLKGSWSGADSPLRVDLRPEAARKGPLPAAAAEARRALAELPPAFSQKELAAHVAFLAAPEREGRGAGSKGLDESVAYVVKKLTEYGLAPLAGKDGYVVRGTAKAGRDGREVPVAAIGGVLRGSKPEWAEQSVVLCAHVDHLGKGWPDVHAGDEGKVHPGADDDASGVAVLLELARTLAANEKPKRSIVFAVFTGEEAGRLGSKLYVAREGPYPAAKAIGAVNVDTVGRLGDQKLVVIGSGSATEWPHIFRGASFVTGVETKMVAEPLDSSDQVSFSEKGIPAVQLFSGAHADYHRPSDTADRIDVAGLAKVAAVAREAITYLADRAEPLTATAATKAPAATAAPAGPGGPPQGRRVSFGTVPDFAFQGPGVKVDSVVAGSPAEKAGVAAGDVVLAIDGRPIAALRDYSELLKTLSPGQTIKATIRRGEKELVLPVTVVER